MSSKMMSKFLLLCFQLLFQFRLVDKVVLKIENNTYTLFDVKSGCIIHSLMNLSEPSRCFDEEFLERYTLRNFVERELIWITFQPKAGINVRSSEVEEYIRLAKKKLSFFEALKRLGVSEKRMRREIKKELIVKKYVESKFGNFDNARRHLKLIEKSIKIEIYFKKMLWKKGSQKDR